jgi:hypothetical protein
LIVIAHGSALRQELSFHRSEILRKFNRIAGLRTAREIVFLESDANLSSLDEVEDAAPAEDRRERAVESTSAPVPTEDGPTEDGPTEEVSPEAIAEDTASSPGEPEAATPYQPVVPAFNAAAYRREMKRIAGEDES